MRVLWSHEARDDLLAIGRFIARDDPRAARTWVVRLKKRTQTAATAPLAGRVVPELARPDTRELIEHNYRIVYRVRQDAVEILTVFEGHGMLAKGEVPDQGATASVVDPQTADD